MDEALRDLYRGCCAGNDAVCFQAFVSYRRSGYSSQQMPREVLYGKTSYQLVHQSPLDFRELLRRHEVSRRVYRAIQFNDGVDISIQGHRGAYCSPREDLSDPRMYSQLEFLFEAPITQTEIYIPTFLVQEIAQGLSIIPNGLTAEELNDIQLLKNAMTSPLCEIQQDQVGNNTEIIIREHTPDFLNGGIYYGFPHQDTISLYDNGAAPYVPVAKVQDVFDFLRARFGLLGEI